MNFSAAGKLLDAEESFLADTTSTSRINARVKPLVQEQGSVIDSSIIPLEEAQHSITRQTLRSG